MERIKITLDLEKPIMDWLDEFSKNVEVSKEQLLKEFIATYIKKYEKSATWDMGDDGYITDPELKMVLDIILGVDTPECTCAGKEGC